MLARSGNSLRSGRLLPGRALVALVLLWHVGLAQESSAEPALRARIPELLAVLQSSEASEDARVAALGDIDSYVRRTDGDPETRKTVLNVLCRLLTQHPSPRVETCVLGTLRDFDAPRLLGIFALTCEADSVEVRLAALDAMARVGRVAAIPTLLYALNDDEPSVVNAAGRWLDQTCWGAGAERDPREAWRKYLHTDAGQRLLIAGLTKLRYSVPGQGKNGIPTHVIALLLDDDLGDAAWQEARLFLSERVPGFSASADRAQASLALRDRTPAIRTLSATVENHGKRQLDRMLADRPEMAANVPGVDRIQSWAAGLFGGRDVGFPVYWSPETPTSGFGAESGLPTGTSVAVFRLKPIAGASPEVLFESYWRALAYEANNVRGWPEYFELCRAALAGAVSRQDWVRRGTALEFKAILKLRAFYVGTWQPWAAKSGARATPELWFVGAGETYDEWIAHYPDDSPYLAAWGGYYDSFAPVVALVKEYSRADAKASPESLADRCFNCLQCASAPPELRLRALEELLQYARRFPASGMLDRCVLLFASLLNHDARATLLTESSTALRASVYTTAAALVDGTSDLQVATSTRLMAMQVVGLYGDVAAIPTLVRAARSEDQRVAAEANLWLIRICWSPAGDGAPPDWDAFFRDGDGKKMLDGSSAKLGSLADHR